MSANDVGEPRSTSVLNTDLVSAFCGAASIMGNYTDFREQIHSGKASSLGVFLSETGVMVGPLDKYHYLPNVEACLQS